MAMDADARSLLASPAPPCAVLRRRPTAAGPRPRRRARPRARPRPSRGRLRRRARRPRPRRPAAPIRRAARRRTASARAGGRSRRAPGRPAARSCGGIDQRHVGLVRQRQPRRVGARGAGDEGGGPASSRRRRSRSSLRARVAATAPASSSSRAHDLGHEQLVAAERGEAAPDGDETVERRAVPRRQEDGPDGVLRGGGAGARPGASRAGSCWRTRRSSSFSAGVGSRPNASTSAARPVRNLSRASACRPARYRAIISWRAQSLVERVVEHELLELGHELRAAAELELGPEAPLHDREAQIAQALDHGTGERLEREVGERRAPPLRERLPVERDGRLGVARRQRRPGVVREALDDAGGRARPAPRGPGSRAGASRRPTRPRRASAPAPGASAAPRSGGAPA